MALTPVQQAKADVHTDEELVARARARDEAGGTRHHAPGTTAACSGSRAASLRDDAEAEDVVQETYVRAFTGLDMFRGDAAFGTWITRIAMNEAFGRLRKRRPTVDWETYGDNRPQAQIIRLSCLGGQHDPEKTMAQGEIRALLEKAIDELPDLFRAVFVARIVEAMTVEETADLFGLNPRRSRPRLHRARRCCARPWTSSSALRSQITFPVRRPVVATAMTETLVSASAAEAGNLHAPPHPTAC